jgi:hypothetical protein
MEVQISFQEKNIAEFGNFPFFFASPSLPYSYLLELCKLFIFSPFRQNNNKNFLFLCRTDFVCWLQEFTFCMATGCFLMLWELAF